MSDKKLSQLSLGTAIAQADLWYSDQSGASVAQKSSVVKTFVRPESIDAMNPIYGVVAGTVSGAVRLSNVTGINSAIADACVNGCEFVDIFVPGAIQIDGTVNLFDTTSASGATTRVPTLRGIRFLTRIEQYNTACIDNIHIGPPVGNALGQGSYGGGVQGLWIVSMVDQSTGTPSAGHLGAQLSITSCEQCTFSELAIGEVNQRIVDHSHFSYKGIAQDSASGPFSCVYRDIEIKGYGKNGFDASAETSGNFHYNIFIRNGGLGEPSLKTSSGFALVIGNGEGTWDQVNIEWSTFDASSAGAIYIPQSAGVRFGHLHMEGLQLSAGFAGVRGAFILVAGAGLVRFESIHMISTNLPTGCNIVSAGVFAFGFGGSYTYVSVGQMLIAQTLTLGAGVNFYLVSTYEASGAGATTNCKVDFNGPCVMFGDGTFSSKLTNWADCNFTTNSQGPANGLGVPPSNFFGPSILTITTSAYGYSAGTFTASMVDGNDTYQWNAGVNGTIVLPLTVMDALLPVSIPPYPGTERTIVNIDATHTLVVHNSAGTNLLTAANLTTGQFVRLRFDGANWIQINAGTKF